MKKKIPFIIILALGGILFPITGLAQETNNSSQPLKEVRWNGTHSATSSQEAVVLLLERLKLEKPYQFQLQSSKTDDLGYTHYSYQLMFEGYQVEHTKYIVHTLKGIPLFANGDYVNDIPDDIINTGKKCISEDLAIQNAYQSEGIVYRKDQKHWMPGYKAPKPKQMIIYNKETNSYQLIYEVDVVKSLTRHQHIAIDAYTGEVVRKQNAFRCAKAQTIFSGEQEITTFDSAGKFYLKDKGRQIATYDAKGVNPFSGDITSSSDLVSNSTDDWDSSDYKVGELDAHFAAQATFDYFLDEHKHKSFDGNGSALNCYVNAGMGGQPNAYWGGYMVIGEPSGETLLATVDIVGHEITHGVSTSTAGFTPDGEAGALGESYSDMFGVLIEDMVYPDYPDSLNYYTGEQFDGMGRNFINPSDGNNPSYYKGQNWDASNQNNHGNGVVHTHWMYLVSKGVTDYKNEKDETYTIQGIGKEKIGKILFRALTVYLTPKSGYAESSRYTIQSAKDLYGACSDEVKALKTAWKAVGLEVDDSDEPNAEFTYTSSRCTSPTEYNFLTPKGSNRTYEWDFGDGTKSTESAPVKTFAQSGVYNVSLKVVGCNNDEDSHTINDIQVENGAACDTGVIGYNNKQTLYSCQGFLNNSVGASGTGYRVNNSASLTIRNDVDDPFELEFINFDYGAFSDRLEIYDGEDESSPKLGEFNYFNQPQGTITSTGGAVTIKEVTDDFSDFDGTGFRLYYQCKTAGSTGIRKPVKDALSVWPNPTNSYINYQTGGAEVFSTQIIDAKGAQVQGITVLESNQSSGKISVNDLSPGLYFLTIQTINGKLMSRFMVQ